MMPVASAQPVVIGPLDDRALLTAETDCGGDCDCACSLPTAAATIPLVPVLKCDTVLRKQAAQVVAIDQEWYVAADPSISPVVLNRAAYGLLERFVQPQPVELAVGAAGTPEGRAAAREGIHALIGRGLLVAKDQPAYSAAASDSELVAWLHVTDRCNLRCSYCYLPHHPKDMSLEQGRSIVDALIASARRHGMERLKLKYAGGEALLRFPMVASLHRYALAAAGRVGLDVVGVVLSNGTLLDGAMAAEMHELGLALMVSIDGLGQYHDAQRPYASGRGSFRAVAAGIELARAHGLTCHLSVTVSGRSVGGLPALMEWLLERDLPFSINYYREHELSAKHQELKLEEHAMIAGMTAALATVERYLPRRSLLHSFVDRANLAVGHGHTCGVGKNYIVFDHSGQISKCQMHQRGVIGKLEHGDPLGLVRADKVGIDNLPVDEKEGCRDCSWRYWCAGGCPLLTFRATGRYDLRSPNCAIYKAVFPMVLRLEGLRILRYGL